MTSIASTINCSTASKTWSTMDGFGGQWSRWRRHLTLCIIFRLLRDVPKKKQVCFLSNIFKLKLICNGYYIKRSSTWDQAECVKGLKVVDRDSASYSTLLFGRSIMYALYLSLLQGIELCAPVLTWCPAVIVPVTCTAILLSCVIAKNLALYTYTYLGPF